MHLMLIDDEGRRIDFGPVKAMLVLEDADDVVQFALLDRNDEGEEKDQGIWMAYEPTEIRELLSTMDGVATELTENKPDANENTEQGTTEEEGRDDSAVHKEENPAGDVDGVRGDNAG